MKPYAEELVSKVFHPVRLDRYLEKYEMEMDDFYELYYDGYYN